MRKIIVTILLLVICNSFCQDIKQQEIKTKVDEVTVFIENAQITRKKTISLTKGVSVLKFNNLSPFIEPKSVQVKATGNITVLAVNHQQNHLNNLKKPSYLIELETSLKTVKEKINLEKIYLSIVTDEVLFLHENIKIGGNEAVNITDLKEAYIFYSKKLTSLRLKEIERKKTLIKLQQEEINIKKQITTVSSKKVFSSGEILVKIEAKNSTSIDLELSYIVKNAGWYPSYDIRAKNIESPIQLIYKANVKQDTKVDWKDVQLKFSSANPNLSGVAPELKTYFINYNTAPPTYHKEIENISGKVFDETGLPIPGANVLVKGTTIGTSTDFDGNYSLTLPKNNNTLEFSFIGYETKTVSISRAIQNIYLNPSENSLDEVVVVAYGRSNKRSKQLEGKVSGMRSIRDATSYSIPLLQVENQTSVNFEIKMPYTILSNNKSYAIDMTQYNLESDYQYFSIPKIEKDAFLVASIQNWEKYNLLEGEANIFFEDTFIGKTILDTRFVSDNLKISLGRDKNVSVNREKISEFTFKKFIGSKKEVIRDWKITVKNNKSQKINLLVLDQVPVSTLDEIKVEILEISKGKLNSKTGEVKWSINLNSKEQKVFELKYLVKHPKNKNLIIE